MHARERQKPSNTGKIALLSLFNSEVRYRGLLNGPPLSYEGLVDNEYETWALYMSPQSIDLSVAVAERKKPVRLLVPDGTWSQASSIGAKLVKRLPVKAVSLRSHEPSQYRLRSEYHPDGMATIEAIARVLGELEGQPVQKEIERVFRIMVERMLYSRGELGAGEVFGGIPNLKK